MLFNATNRAAARFLAVCTALSMLLSFVPVFPQVANAATSVFSDGFEATPGFPNWDSADNSWQNNGSSTHSGVRKAQVAGNTQGDDILLKTVSTEGFENTGLSFWYRMEGLDDGDSVTVEWFDGSSWNNLVTFNGADLDADDVVAWTEWSGSLPVEADDNADFQLRFVANLNAGNDKFFLDDVNVSGDALVVACSPQHDVAGPTDVQNTNTGDYFDTIQDAIDDCDTTNGHTIEVTTGTYTEDVLVNKELTIDGNSVSVIEGQVRILSSNTTLNAFTIDGAATSESVLVFIPEAADGATNIQITNNTIQNTDTTGANNTAGLEIAAGDSVSVSGNTFQNLSAANSTEKTAQGILVGDTGSSADITNVTIQNNTFSDIDGAKGAYGIIVNRPVTGLEILGNTISNITGNADNTGSGWASGIGLDADTVDAVLRNNVVDSVSAFGGAYSAFGIIGQSTAAAESITVEYNDFLVDQAGENRTDGDVDFSLNWWGSDTGPVVFDVTAATTTKNADGLGGTIFQTTAGGDVEMEPWLCGPFATTPGTSVDGSCEGVVATATVTMCKVNEAEDVLDGWTLHLLGDLVETVEVPSDGSIVSSSNSLTGPYAFVATGTTYQYRGDETSISDATFSRRLASGDPISAVGQPYDPWIHMNELPGGYNGMLGITVDSATTEWGDVFNPLHEYALQYEGDGDQTTFQIRDSHYHDNTGSLFVDIFEGYTGVTENGCVTFDDVPYGTYEADEIMQDGWRNLSGLGTVVVDEETEEFTIQNTDQAPEMCSVTIVSDETNTVEEKEGFAQVLSFIHSYWTAAIGGGAEWIWGDNPVVDPEVDETQTFVKTFEWNGAVASAMLDIAVDNFYTVTLNGEVVGSSTVNSFQNTDVNGWEQDVYDVSSVIQTGVNTLEITVENLGQEGQTATQNPAGLLYNLTVVGTEEGEECTVAPKVASLEITNPATDGETLEGTHTFEAEYIDDDETVDTILWAIREGTCAAGTNTVAGNVDGFSDGSTFVGNLFSAMVDMSTWEDGEYCFVVNPQEGGGTDFRETRTFLLDNEEPVACVPDVNLLANASFEEPEINGQWELVTPVAWVVKTLGGDDLLIEIQKNVNGWFPSHGEQYAELDATESSEISQTIPTVLGETYRLAWDFAARPNTFETNNILKVFVDGVELAENKANGGSSLVWTSDSVEFEGTGSDVEIMFADDGDSDSLGTFLDNTSLVCNPAPEVGPYCGDGEVNQEWETCDGGESCTNYCLADNMCHDVRLAKIDLGTSASQSVSFDGMIYLGTSTNPIPSNTWFNLDEVGDSLANLIAEDVDGLAVERNHTGSTTLRLAFRGGNESKDIDIVKGSIEFVGGETYSGSVVRGVMGSNYDLEPENGSGGFPDVFDVANNQLVNFDMRADTGNDGATLTVRDGDDYGICEPDGGGDGEGDDEDFYEVFGYVWNDEDEDGEQDEGEGNRGAGVLVTIGNGEDEYATTTNDEGYYSFLVPEGTWTITEDPGDEWDHTTDSSIVVTVPNPEVTDASLLQTIFSFFIPTAHAETFEDHSGPHNFGNVFVGSPVVSLTGGGGGGGTYISLSANSNNDDDVPEGQVLGAQTSVIPAGAPNAGFGGTSTNVSFTMTLMQVLSVLLAVAAFARFSSHAK